jgi:hypothetical protein
MSFPPSSQSVIQNVISVECKKTTDHHRLVMWTVLRHDVTSQYIIPGRCLMQQHIRSYLLRQLA